MYNHKKQLVLTLVFGVLVGAGAIRFAYDNGIITTSPNEATTGKPVNWDDFIPVKMQSTQPRESDEVVGTANNEEAVQPNQLCELQEYMRSQGMYKGIVDGLPGKRTKSGISKAQKEFNFPVTGIATVGLLKSLRSKDLEVYKIDPFRDIASQNNPTNGEILSSTAMQRIAPLEIRTTPGTGDYAIKLENISTGKSELMFFSRGGKHTKVEAPLGKYMLKYANGTTWFSNTCMFGVRTTYHKAKETLNFSSSGQRVAGYTIELILQRNGNLRTQKLSENEW